MASFRVDRLSWSVGLGTTLGLAGQSASSFIFFALNHNAGLSVEHATEALTAEGIVMGITMLAISPVIHRLALRPILWMAIFLVLAAQAGSGVTQGFVPILGARAASGVGFGLIYSIASASGAASPVPERVYAAAGTIQLIVGTAFNPLLGRGQAMGQWGVFMAVGLFAAALAAGLIFAPPPTRLGATTRAAAAVPMRPDVVIAVLAMMVVFAVGTNGVYIYYVPVAHEAGLSDARLGDGLAIVSLVGSLGGVAANRLGVRLGRVGPLVIGLIAIGVTSIWLLAITAAWQFWIAFTLWVMFYIFVNAYLFGLAVAADQSGRLASATGASLILANAGGTWAVGWVAARTGSESWGPITLTMCAVAALFGTYAIWATRAPTS